MAMMIDCASKRAFLLRLIRVLRSHGSIFVFNISLAYCGTLLQVYAMHMSGLRDASWQDAAGCTHCMFTTPACN